MQTAEIWANHPGTKIQALADVLRHVLDDQCPAAISAKAIVCL